MLKIASPGAVSSFVGSEMFATEKGVLNEKLVNFPKKVHSGLAQWLTSAIHDNKHNRRTAGPCVWCLCLRTSALSKHPGVLLPGEAHALPCLQETLPKEAETLSLRWRLCSLRTSHAGRLKSFYKECTLTSLMRGSETRKRVRKEEKGEGGREGRKEGKPREAGGGKGWFKDR